METLLACGGFGAIGFAITYTNLNKLPMRKNENRIDMDLEHKINSVVFYFISLGNTIFYFCTK